MTTKPRVGKIVHFIQFKDESYGDKSVIHLPAIIVAIHSDICVNLQVLTDGSNSGDDCGLKRVTSVLYDPFLSPPENGTWHWPEEDEE